MPVGLGLGRDHEPHYGRREGMVLMPYDPLWVGQLAGLRGRTVEPAAGPRGTRCHRQYSFRRQPEVTQRGKGVTTQTCFLPRGRRAQARSVGEGASPCQANLGVFHGRLLRRGVRAKGAGPSGRNKPAGFPLTFCLFVCLFSHNKSKYLFRYAFGIIYSSLQTSFTSTLPGNLLSHLRAAGGGERPGQRYSLIRFGDVHTPTTIPLKVSLDTLFLTFYRFHFANDTFTLTLIRTHQHPIVNHIIAAATLPIIS